MKKSIAVLMIVFLSVFAQAAAADDPGKDVTEYTFEDDTLVGELLGISEASIVVRPPARERSLIRMRSHFVPEMLKSVEQI